MLHVILALYILCFAGGVTLILLTFFAARRLAAASFRHLALLFLAATLIIFLEALKTYEKALATDFGHTLHISALVLSFAANGMMGWLLPLVALESMRRELSRTRGIVHSGMAAFLAVLGGMKEFVAPLLLWNVNYVALLGLHVYCAILVIRGFSKIEHPWVRSLVRSFLVFLAVIAPLGVAQLVLQNVPSAPELLHDYPLVQLVYYLGFVILVLSYMARYILGPPAVQPPTLSDDFIQRYGISKREGDIISMMVQGYSNSGIAEKLFISTITVKNHVYHIYQKTGAGNKVQLINMINTLK